MTDAASRVSCNTLLARDKDVSPAVQARKCLNRRERVRTCAGLATLKKVWTTFFNILLGDSCRQESRCGPRGRSRQFFHRDVPDAGVYDQA